MSRIRILDEGTAARIAAGEVVERPASIVKELVENSIDAGATAISVTIENGGLRRISVTDNGFGIEKDDVPMTVFKHATSKIENSRDLEHISSMGFRGEALFSIAAVSMFTLRSRTRDAETGVEMKVSGGKTEYIREAGLPEGTTAIAENLFYNTPARLRFIKSTSAETAAVSDLMTRFILGNPSVSFRYNANGSSVYHSPGSGKLIDAVISVYGRQIKDNVAPAEFEYNGTRVYGYIGKHTFYQKTARNQSVFVNGRYIKSETVRKAVTRAYGERILKATYPFYVLYIEMPYSEVDVNVHPNKMQVHFRDEGKLEYVVEEAVKRAVEASETTGILHIKPADNVSADKNPTEDIKKAPTSGGVRYTDDGIGAFKGYKTGDGRASLSLGQYADYSQSRKKAEDDTDKLISSILGPEITVKKSEIIEQKSVFDDGEGYAFLDPKKGIAKEEEEPSGESLKLADISGAIYIGSAFNSFLIYELGETLYLIDQHAAHERLIYDSLTKGEKVISQQLLMPEVLSFPHDQMMLLEHELGLLGDMGIDAELFGPLSIKVSAVPQIVGEINIRGFFEDILEGLSYSNRKEIKLARDRVARAACKRAVKAGQAIKRGEAENILKEISATGVIPHCPHGRPLAVAITKTELEKGFKRIV